jgi:thymidylate synthase
MKNYLDLMTECSVDGIDMLNERTGIVCRTLVGAQLEYDMAEGFPAATSKKLAFKAVKGELLGFFRGCTNAADFRALDCKIWDANANKTKAWLENPFRKGTDDLGRIYSAQWTDWKDTVIVALSDFPEQYEILLAAGYIDIGLTYAAGRIMQRSINQLEEALYTILTNPSDRRIIVSGWNPGDINKAALPACHMDYRFTPIDGTLHVVMTIR